MLVSVGQRTGRVVLSGIGRLGAGIMPANKVGLSVRTVKRLIGNGQRDLNKCRQREQENGDLSL